MKSNVGGMDRVLRIVAGLAILGWGVMSGNWLGAIGLVPLATGVLGWCPAYCPLKLSTAGSCCSGNKSCGTKDGTPQA